MKCFIFCRRSLTDFVRPYKPLIQHPQGALPEEKQAELVTGDQEFKRMENEIKIH